MRLFLLLMFLVGCACTTSCDRPNKDSPARVKDNASGVGNFSNIMEERMTWRKLKPEMTKDEVRKLLGEPVRVYDVWWHYRSCGDGSLSMMVAGTIHFGSSIEGKYADKVVSWVEP